MKKSKILIILFLIVFSFGILEAGSFEDALTGMLENNAEMYAQPLVTGFGTAMNSGLYKRAKTKTGLLPIPIGIDVGVVFGGALVSEDDLNFNYEFMDTDLDIDLESIDASLSNVTLSMSDLYTADKDETPTASGDGDGAQISAKNQSDVVDALVAEMNPANPTEETQYRTALNNSYSEIQALIPDFQFPDGLDVPIIPTVNIQVNVRVPFGIELALKGLPPYDISDVGEIKLIGAGIRKDLPIPILDVSAGVFYQSMSIGDVLVAKNIAVHAEVGKTLGIPGIKISPFIGAGMDKSTVDLSYTIAGGTLPGVEADKEMSFNMTGENQFRANVGLSLQIAVLHIQGEYSIGKYQAVALNLGVSFK